MFDQPAPAAEPQPQKPQSVAPSQPQSAGMPVTVGDIHTMPEKFLGAQGPRVMVTRGSGGGGKRILVIVAVVLLLGGVGYGAYWYINTPGNIFMGTQTQPPVMPANQAPQQPVVPDPNQNTNTAPVEDPGARTRDAQRVSDLIRISKALAEYYAQFNAYPQFLSVIPKDILADVPVDPKTKAPYTYTPKDNRSSYTIVFDVEAEAAFEGKTVPAGTWEFLPEEFTGTTNTNTNQTATTTSPDTSGLLDKDGDGLTAAEELLFTTSPDSNDTDSDGFPDASEIRNFFSPVASGAVKLDAAGLITPLTIDQNIRAYYPTSWSANPSSQNPSETLIVAPTGENFTVTIADNPDNLTSWEWYVQNVSYDYNKQNVDIINVAGREAVRSLDGLKVYVAIDNRVVSLVYNLSSAGTIQYPNVFDLLISRLSVQ